MSRQARNCWSRSRGVPSPSSLLRRGGNPRRRQIDLAIAATAIVEQVPLLTHDLADLVIVRDLVGARLA